MTSADGRYTIVHNGEIYNFLELAEELGALGHVFRTNTDTEVILAAYAQWGVDCLRRFNGIWAFAIWDAHECSLLLSRDRLGVKPLFLAEDAGRLAFASEIKALRTLPWVSADPDPGVVRNYLVEGVVDRGSRTFYRDVKRFPAAHALLISRAGRRWHCYWEQPPLSTDASLGPGPDDAALIDDFRTRLVDAIALQLRSDVPVGTCLSGGLDSSSIVSLAASLRAGSPTGRDGARRERQANPQLAFFAEFRDAGIDERPYVDAVIALTGAELRTTTPDRDRFLESLEAVMHAQDEPFGSLSIVAQYEVMRIAHAAGVKVLLDGQGADELLGGYLNYPAIRWAGALRSRSLRTVFGGLRAVFAERRSFVSTLGYALVSSRVLPGALLPAHMPSRWLGPVTRSANGPTSPSVRAPGTPLATRLWRDLVSDNLPGLLRYEDRNSMAFSIEARVPFLDHRLVEFCLALPDRLKVVSHAQRKVVLSRAMRGIVPEIVVGRRDKVAFQPPERRWLTESEPVWRKLASSSIAEDEGLLVRGAIVGAIEAFRAGRIRSAVLWRVLNLEMWLREGTLP